MKRSILIPVAIFFCLTARSIWAQSSDVELGRFRVRLVTGDRLEGTNGKLTAEGLSGTDSYDSAVFIPLEDIHDLDRCKGNQARNGLAIGGLVGAGIFGLAVLSVATDSDYDLDESKLPVAMVVYTGAGALIGLAIGCASRAWEDVPLQPAVGYDPHSGEVKFALSFSF